MNHSLTWKSFWNLIPLKKPNDVKFSTDENTNCIVRIYAWIWCCFMILLFQAFQQNILMAKDYYNKLPYLIYHSIRANIYPRKINMKGKNSSTTHITNMCLLNWNNIYSMQGTMLFQQRKVVFTAIQYALLNVNSQKCSCNMETPINTFQILYMVIIFRNSGPLFSNGEKGEWGILCYTIFFREKQFTNTIYDIFTGHQWWPTIILVEILSDTTMQYASSFLHVNWTKEFNIVNEERPHFPFQKTQLIANKLFQMD